MKLLFFFILISLSPTYSSALPKEGFKIETNFKYQTPSKKSISTSQEFVMDKDMKTWVTLTDLKENVVLLGRVKEVTNTTIHMEYLVVDGTVKPNGVVSMPSIVALFGQPAEISTGPIGETPTISISMTAKKTEYTPKAK